MSARERINNSLNSPSVTLDQNRIALGIQQPWAELILRGFKTIEVRSLPTRQRGTIYLYASQKTSPHRFAEELIQQFSIDIENLPRGLLVGTIDLVDCRSCIQEDHRASGVPPEHLKGKFAWKLANPFRFPEPIPVRFLPYGVWFYPFRRKGPA